MQWEDAVLPKACTMWCACQDQEVPQGKKSAGQTSAQRFCAESFSLFVRCFLSPQNEPAILPITHVHVGVQQQGQLEATADMVSRCRRRQVKAQSQNVQLCFDFDRGKGPGASASK
mmetsp:Transcript_87429/g.152235  ORF Transcript_87429/g.152235 Transcript_87429/m.152235 type:complete len:116 (-) Transcript_87429:64-411(-)